MKLLDIVVGSEQRNSINQRILNAAIFVSALFTAYVFIGGQAVGQSWFIQAPILLIIAGFIVLYVLSRRRMFSIIIRPAFITFGLVSISLYYFFLNGIRGEIPMYFIMGAVLSITVVHRKYYLLVLLTWVIAFLICVFLEFENPDWITTDKGNAERGIEHIIATIGIMSFVAAMIILFKNLFETERKALRELNSTLESQAEELYRLKIEADNANRAKSEFLGTMSHEIRTPLNAVIGMSYILLKENPRPEQKNNLKVLKFSAENLLSLINDVLDYNKIEAGKLILEDSPFDLNSMLESVFSAFQMKAEEKRINLKLELPEGGFHSSYRGDVTRVTQVLNNLISNAVKFTERGSVSLTCAIDEEEEFSSISFTITDTGIGIPEELREKIFDSFIQAHPSITRKYGGTGLGLAISKELVRLMGGELSLKSQVGMGSTFEFTLMFNKVEPSEIRGLLDVDGMDAHPLTDVRILVAEDNAVNAIVSRKFLEGWGAHVEIARDGKEAIDRWRQGDFDLILMDLRMPELDGVEATRYIRESKSQHSSIPILALTASAMLEEQNEIFEAGMNEYVSKPFNPEELLSKIQKQLMVKGSQGK
ncbi:MAG: response regulator [Bacteroidetes bacterium]|nr:MAG: response regulator [Bacteroidota bacterium]